MRLSVSCPVGRGYPLAFRGVNLTQESSLRHSNSIPPSWYACILSLGGHYHRELGLLAFAGRHRLGRPYSAIFLATLLVPRCLARSEERRVGKECRSWWS